MRKCYLENIGGEDTAGTIEKLEVAVVECDGNVQEEREYTNVLMDE